MSSGIPMLARRRGVCRPGPATGISACGFAKKMRRRCARCRRSCTGETAEEARMEWLRETLGFRRHGGVPRRGPGNPENLIHDPGVRCETLRSMDTWEPWSDPKPFHTSPPRRADIVLCWQSLGACPATGQIVGSEPATTTLLFVVKPVHREIWHGPAVPQSPSLAAPR